LTSFTQTKLIQSEQKEDLRTELMSLVYPFRTNQPVTIRVDPHLSFLSLREDKILKEHEISLEIGQEKNVNKNSVAERSIQELEEEVKKISPNSSAINDMELIKATHALNSKIRHTHRSARELLLKRDQYTEENFTINDTEVSEKQLERRLKDNKLKLDGNNKVNVVKY